MVDPRAVEDWLRVHRLVVQQENAFAALALRAAAREVSLGELDERRDALMGLRDSCVAAYTRAFGTRGAGQQKDGMPPTT
jgi:hypothetical protein